MSAVLPVLLGGLLAAAMIALRLWLSDSWRRSLVALELLLPTSLSVEQIAGWLGGVAAIGHPSRFGIVPLRPLGLEVVATSSGVRHFLLAAERTRDRYWHRCAARCRESDYGRLRTTQAGRVPNAWPAN